MVFGSVAAAIASSGATVVGLYPYRDFVKTFDPRQPKLPPATFITARYHGMMTNPIQPLIISAPMSVLLVLGNLFPFLPMQPVNALLFGMTQTFVKLFSIRLHAQGKHHVFMYAGASDCISVATRQMGVFSWFVGSLATAWIALFWYVGPLNIVLHRRNNNGFLGDFYDAFRLHSMATIATAPMRNCLESALHVRERSSGVHNFNDWLQVEKGIFNEGLRVGRRMFQDEGLIYLFRGTLKTTFKTSVHFGLSVALYKKFMILESE